VLYPAELRARAPVPRAGQNPPSETVGGLYPLLPAQARATRADRRDFRLGAPTKAAGAQASAPPGAVMPAPAVKNARWLAEFAAKKLY
jgi:hypothetical protein